MAFNVTHGFCHGIPPTLSDETLDEGRSIQFFVERTAREWSGWYDSHFWRALVLQASALHPCIRHGLVSLAAIHEALEMPTEQLRQQHQEWALQQGKKALLYLSRDYSDLSLSSLCIAHLLIFAFTCFLHVRMSLDAMRLTYDLDEQLQRQMTTRPPSISQTERLEITNYLQPIIARQKSKHGQLVDLIWSLSATDASHFDVLDRPRIPTSFVSIDHARLILEQLLNWTTFQAKSTPLSPNTLPPGAEIHLTTWLSALGTLQSSYERCSHKSSSDRHYDKLNIDVLRLSAHIFFMIIKCMNSASDMVFDDYTEMYKDVLTVYKAVITYRKSLARTNFSISTEASLLTFVGNTVCRWCHDPLVRKSLIDLLQESNAVETHESAAVWAQTARHLQLIEEANIYPPPQTAAEIPESARVQFDAASFYMKASLIGIRYVRYPFAADSNTETVYVSHPGCECYLQWDFKVLEPDDYPDMIIARGYCSWLKQASNCDYYTVQEPKFYFNIPRV